MPNMKDVADAAGVSVSTVSHVINETRYVSEDLQQRVHQAMEELGYKPNALARGLASRRSRIIALLFPESDRGLGLTELEFVTSAANAARENEYNLVLWSSALNDLNMLRQLIRQGLADGVVVMEVHLNDERINLLRELGLPFSLIGRCKDNIDINYVDIDFEQTIQESIRYLSELGHTHIAFLNQSQIAYDTQYGPVIRAQLGFDKTMRAAGLNNVSRFCDTTPKAGYEAFNQLLTEHPDLTALVTMNERAVPGVMRAIADRGWRIPDDFSLILAIAAASVAEMTIPPLTTMEAMTSELGRYGVELLIQQLEKKEKKTEQILMPSRLVTRGSSGPCS